MNPEIYNLTPEEQRHLGIKIWSKKYRLVSMLPDRKEKNLFLLILIMLLVAVFAAVFKEEIEAVIGNGQLILFYIPLVSLFILPSLARKDKKYVFERAEEYINNKPLNV